MAAADAQAEEWRATALMAFQAVRHVGDAKVQSSHGAAGGCGGAAPLEYQHTQVYPVGMVQMTYRVARGAQNDRARRSPS